MSWKHCAVYNLFLSFLVLLFLGNVLTYFVLSALCLGFFSQKCEEKHFQESYTFTFRIFRKGKLSKFCSFSIVNKEALTLKFLLVNCVKSFCIYETAMWKLFLPQKCVFFCKHVKANVSNAVNPRSFTILIPKMLKFRYWC